MGPAGSPTPTTCDTLPRQPTGIVISLVTTILVPPGTLHRRALPSPPLPGPATALASPSGDASHRTCTSSGLSSHLITLSDLVSATASFSADLDLSPLSTTSATDSSSCSSSLAQVMDTPYSSPGVGSPLSQRRKSTRRKVTSSRRESLSSLSAACRSTRFPSSGPVSLLG